LFFDDGRREFGSGKRNECTQTKIRPHNSVPASLVRSQLSSSAGSFSLMIHRQKITFVMFACSFVQHYCYQLMGPSSAENHSSHTDSAFRHQGGGVRGGNSSSFDTSATQIRGGEGDGSSSDLSMSSPPLPSTFDFVIKNAKGKCKRTNVDRCCVSCYSQIFRRCGRDGGPHVLYHAGYCV
jgi:hypothetical protein